MKKLRILVLGSLVIAAGMLLLELEGCEPEGNKNTPGKSSAEIAPDKPTSSGGGSGSQQGDSGPSGDTSAGAPAEPEENIATVPGQPGQAVEAPGQHTLTSITIQWTPPASRGTGASGSAVPVESLRYDVQYKRAGSSEDWVNDRRNQNIAGDPGPTDTMLHFEVKELKKETGYIFQVRARNGAKDRHAGSWSPPSDAISTPSPRETAPEALRQAAIIGRVTSNSVEIQWTQPAPENTGKNADGNAVSASALRYDVQRKIATGEPGGWVNVPEGQNIPGSRSGRLIKFTVTSLESNTKYKFRVRVRNNNRNRNSNKSGWSRASVAVITHSSYGN